GKISDFSSGLWNKANNYISGPTVTNIKNTVSITKQGLSETFSGKSKVLPNNIETLQSISNAGKEVKGRIKFDVDLEIASTKLDDTINIKETTNNLPVLYDEEFANAQRKLYKLGDSDGVSNPSGRLIPGKPGVVTGGNSTKLGKNIMESIGLKRSTKWTGHQAQHIIPAEMADNPVLQKIGMNLDDASNGILLRTPDADLSAMSRHRGYHSVYNDVVKRQLNNMDVNQSVDILQKQVFDLQNDLRKLQESGLPLYPSQGATVDLWERSLNRIRK
ncbi:MAG: AHH domain-containing protein, partial [Clostridium sp.]